MKPIWPCNIATCWWRSGARFDDRVIGNPKHFFNEDRKIIHIDIDPSSISKRVKVDVPIVGNVTDVLDELIKQLKARKEKPDQTALDAWWTQIDSWRARDCLKYDRASTIIKPQWVIEKLYEVTGGECFHYLGRGPASDVGCPVLQIRPAPAMDQFGGPGNHGIRSSGGNGRPVCQSGRTWSPALPAKPASRCAFRSCPRASNTICHSRSLI